MHGSSIIGLCMLWLWYQSMACITLCRLIVTGVMDNLITNWSSWACDMSRVGRYALRKLYFSGIKGSGMFLAIHNDNINTRSMLRWIFFSFWIFIVRKIHRIDYELSYYHAIFFFPSRYNSIHTICMYSKWCIVHRV